MSLWIVGILGRESESLRVGFRILCTGSNQGGVKSISGGTGNLWAMGQRLGSDSVLQGLVRTLEDRVSKEMLKFFGGGLRVGHRRVGVCLVS